MNFPADRKLLVKNPFFIFIPRIFEKRSFEATLESFAAGAKSLTKPTDKLVKIDVIFRNAVFKFLPQDFLVTVVNDLHKTLRSICSFI